MADEVKCQVAFAMTQQQQSQAAPPDPNVAADLSQQKRYYASMEHPVDTRVPAIQTMAQQRYPVDEITQRIPCDLQSAVKNLTFMVAYGTAMPTQPGDMHHGQEIPSGYARVGVE